jgi:hypothetical protein
VNIYLGLRRISAVVWGLLFIFLFIAMAVPFLNAEAPWRSLGGTVGTAAVMLVLFLICHGVTKWVLAGFFPRDVNNTK